jgi:hypothetical protein
MRPKLISSFFGIKTQIFLQSEHHQEKGFRN